MDDLDVILGMDWLSRYKAIIDCEGQSVMLSGPRGEKVKCRSLPKGPKVKKKSCLHWKSEN
jgi:aspartyl protease